MNSKVAKINNLIKQNPAIFAIILFFVFVMLSLSSLFAYAWFSTNVQGEGKQITVSTSDAVVNFIDSPVINETGIVPGTTITKTFSITNTTHGSLQYKINWEYLTNNLSYRNCLKYTITSTGGGGALASTQVPNSGEHINILNNLTVPGNTTQTYTMTITYEDNNTNQDADKNKSVIGKLEVTNIEGTSVLPTTTTETYTPPASSTSINDYSVSDLVKIIYPVGSIFTSASSTNPSTLFPGTTWEAYAQGRTLVGNGTSTQDEAGKTKTFSSSTCNTVNGRNPCGVYNAVVPYHRHELKGSGAKVGDVTDPDNNGSHTHSVSGSTDITGTTLVNRIKQDNPPVSSPTTTPGRQIATTDEGLIEGPDDDYGAKTYYFRGNVQDNYVTFANKTWRIIRINGDGSVRMILNGTTGTNAVWYNSQIINNYNSMINGLTYSNSPLKTEVDNWYNSNIGNNNTYDSMVATGKYCSDKSHTGSTKPIYFGPYNRLYTVSSASPQYTCPNSSDIYNLKTATVTADEVAFAGGIRGTTNTSYYLYTGSNYWTMSPDSWLNYTSDPNVVAFSVDNNGRLAETYLNASYSVRPVINLKSDVEYNNGEGTSGSPYTVKAGSESNTTDGEHTHEIPAGSISVRSTATTITTENESSHEHMMTGSFTLNSGTTGNGSAHSHTVTTPEVQTTAGEGAHTHTTVAKTGLTTASAEHSHSLAANAIQSSNTGAISTNTDGAHSHDMGNLYSNGSGSSSAYTMTSKRTLTTRRTKAPNQSHTHYIPSGRAVVYNTNAITTSANTGHSHTFNIPSLSVASSGAHQHTTEPKSVSVNNESSHTHTIPILNVSIAGETASAEEDHDGWHIHGLTIPALTSTNTSAITISSTGSGHSHTFTGTATTAGEHTHSLSGNTGYVGTYQNEIDANLQPYIAVYRWRRTS